MHSGIAYWISNYLIIVLWTVGANVLLKNRFSRVITIAAEILIHFSWWFFSEKILEAFSVYRFLSGILLFIVILRLFHDEELSFTIITAIAYYVSTALSEFMLSIMLPWELVASGEIFEKHAFSLYSIYLFIFFIYTFFATVALASYKNNYYSYLSKWQKFLFLLFPISQLTSISAWSYPLADAESFLSPLRTITIISLDVLADIALFVLISNTAKNTELSVRNKMLEEEIRIQEFFYKGVSSKIEDVRKMRHDIDDHLYTMQALIRQGKTEEASDYVSKIVEGDEATILFPDCRNMIVTSYLVKKTQDLEEENIRLIGDIHIPETLEISNPDLICILGNIINNAQEAVENTSERQITLSIIYKDPYLSFSCSNPIAENQVKTRRIKELERGLGTSILSHLANKYDGYYHHEINGNIYKADITVKNIKAEKNNEED